MKGVKQGFAVIELIFVILIICALAAIAVPSYKNYARGVYYAGVVKAASPYKVSVTQCVKTLSTLTGCNAGTHNIPPAITTPQGAVSTLTVTDGVITVVPVASQDVTENETYVLTPTLDTSGTLTWVSSGGGVRKGYVK